jgi:hypothetical protein
MAVYNCSGGMRGTWIYQLGHPVGGLLVILTHFDVGGSLDALDPLAQYTLA